MSDIKIITVVRDRLGLSQPCPYGLIPHVGSDACKECEHNCHIHGDEAVACNYEFMLDGCPVKWRICKAGFSFPEEALVIPQGVPGQEYPRIAKCAVWDSRYILLSDLMKLRIKDKELINNK
jgi:hypothetical protein